MEEIWSGLAVLLSAVLVVAGSSKFFSPRPLARSLLIVTGGRLRQVRAEVAARGIGVLELVAAVLVSLPGTVALGAVLGALLGLGIVGWVVMAAWRRVTVSCGCFGGNSAKPLGVSNAGAGFLLAAGFAALLVPGTPASVLPPATQFSLVALASVALVLALRFGDFYPPIRKGLGIAR